MGPSPPNSRLPHALFGIYLAVCLVCMVWPVYAWVGGRVEPRFLGLPLAFAWHIGWIVLTLFVLFAYDRFVRSRD